MGGGQGVVLPEHPDDDLQDWRPRNSPGLKSIEDGVKVRIYFGDKYEFEDKNIDKNHLLIGTFGALKTLETNKKIWFLYLKLV